MARAWTMVLAAAIAAAPRASEKEVKEAVLSYETAEKTRDPAKRKEALLVLARVAHPAVSDRILRVATGPDDDGLRAEAFRALAGHSTEASRLGPAVAAFLAAEAKEARKRAAKGDFGLVMDRKTGDPVLDTGEGKAALAAKRARASVIAGAVELLVHWGRPGREGAETARTFLQDGSDALAVQSLRALGAWKDEESLPAILDLFRMYPAESKWETGSVAQRDGTNASAKAAWMGVFGDPDKRRARPEVVKALKAAVLSITGRNCPTPADLESLIAERRAGRRRAR